jgi:putative SOS response-associated peptidase YedK
MAETVATKPAFRSAFKKRQRLILADGYYEWTGTKGKKRPRLFHLKDHKPFSFARLWERWKTRSTRTRTMEAGTTLSSVADICRIRGSDDSVADPEHACSRP